MPESDSLPAPRLTIGLMTRNYAAFIRQAIDSVLAQTVTDWELIISDDGSTDDTAAIVTPYLADPRISYVRHDPPLGQAGNWAYCLQAGSAPIVAVLHADDAYEPNAVEWALSTLDNHPQVDFAFGNARRVKRVLGPDGPRMLERVGWSLPDRVLPGPDAFVALAERNHALPSCSFVRRSILTTSGLPDARLKMMVDVEFFRRLAAASRQSAWTNDVITRYHEHGQSTSAHTSANGVFEAELRNHLSLLKSNLDRHDLSRRLTPVQMRAGFNAIRRAMGDYLFRQGVGKSLDGRQWAGLNTSLAALKLWPVQIIKPRVLVDLVLMLAGCGPLLRRLHAKRLRGVIGDESARPA